MDTFSKYHPTGMCNLLFPLVLQPQEQLVPRDYSLELSLAQNNLESMD